MVFGWGDSQDAYNQTYNNQGNPQPDNQASLGHEFLGGAAAFAGMKMFEDHQRKEGKPVSHQFAKELLVGFAGAEADRLVETKGEDFYDREKVRHQAKQNAEHLYDQHYGGNDQYDPNQYGPPREMQDQFGDNFGNQNQGGY